MPNGGCVPQDWTVLWMVACLFRPLWYSGGKVFLERHADGQVVCHALPAREAARSWRVLAVDKGHVSQNIRIHLQLQIMPLTD